MSLAGQPAGDALSALRYLGPAGVNGDAINRIREALSKEEFEVLRGATTVMPSWLSDAFFRREHPVPAENWEPAIA